MFKRFLFVLMVGIPSVGHCVWDVTTPAGSEAKSNGDDRIREFKTDIQTSLRYFGNDFFPGSDTSNPRYIPTISTVTTSGRPTGNAAPSGRVVVNITSGTLDIINSAGAWSSLDVVGSSSIVSSDIAISVAGDGLSGGGGEPFRVNADSNSFTIFNDTVTLKSGGVTSSHILDGTIAAADLASNLALPGTAVTIPSQVRFIAYNNTTDSNVTGDNTNVTVDFDTEVVDTGNNFASDTFTAPTTGYYQLSFSITFRDTTSGNKCEAKLITSNRTYVQEKWPASNDAISFSTLADMDTGDTAKVDFQCSGGTLVVDVLGNGSSTGGAGYSTFFSGWLAN